MLARALEIVRFKDSQPFRQSIFDYLASHRGVVRFVRGIHRVLGDGFLSRLMVCIYGLRAFVGVPTPRSRGDVVAVSRYRNEGRQFDFVESCLPEALCRITIGGFGLSGLFSFPWKACYRAVAESNGDFLVACRVAATVGFYYRLKPLLATLNPKAVLVSSDSNPYAMAAWAAARELGCKTIYVTHGHLPDDPPDIDFDLSLLDGPALRDVYGQVGGEVVYKGCEGEYRPMDTAGLSDGERLRVGIFCSLIVDWAVLRPLVERISNQLGADRVRLRMHPNRTIRHPDAGMQGVEVSDGATVLTDDAVCCDVVVTGNSSAHLTLLKYGVPTAYVRNLDLCPHDLYRFIEKGIIPAFDTPEEMDIAAIRAFYADPTWAERFAHFDATYPGKDLSGEVSAALGRLLDA